MQPALADVVQYLTVPGSTATAGARLSASRSLPSWLPPERGCPKSSEYVTEPTTGNTIAGTPPREASTVEVQMQAARATAESRRELRIRWTVAACSPDAKLGPPDSIRRA